jgi:hypothetical protein
MRTRMHDFAAILVLLVGSQAGASPVNLRVTDQTGAAFPDVLVIVKSLAGKGEIFRALTDQAGRAPERDLTAGLYRAIATCPYGICETRVTEFLVGDAPLELELKVDVSPTRGNVAIVGPSNQLKLDVLDAQGKPAIAAVLVRDSNAEFEQWYKTNSEGEVDCRATGNQIFISVGNSVISAFFHGCACGVHGVFDAGFLLRNLGSSNSPPCPHKGRAHCLAERRFNCFDDADYRNASLRLR